MFPPSLVGSEHIHLPGVCYSQRRTVLDGWCDDRESHRCAYCSGEHITLNIAFDINKKWLIIGALGVMRRWWNDDLTPMLLIGDSAELWLRVGWRVCARVHGAINGSSQLVLEVRGLV